MTSQVEIRSSPCSQALCVERSTLSYIARHGTPVHSPCLHEPVTVTLSVRCPALSVGLYAALTDLSQAVNAASAARYLAELQATPTAC